MTGSDRLRVLEGDIDVTGRHIQIRIREVSEQVFVVPRGMMLSLVSASNNAVLGSEAESIHSVAHYDLVPQV